MITCLIDAIEGQDVATIDPLRLITISSISFFGRLALIIFFFSKLKETEVMVLNVLIQ